MNQPLASIHPDAIIHPSVIIDPFVTIGPNVEIGAGTHVMSSATVMEGTRIGKNCKIFPSAVVGAVPQDLKFKGEDTLAIIGDNTTIRECATVHRGTFSKGVTRVGANCLIMAYSHVAHDCVVGNNVIMSNATQLAGEVVVDDFAVIGGGTLVHQFTHIGSYVMVQGGCHINKDLPPYVLVAHEPAAFAGINLVGLRRRGFSDEQIALIQDIYRVLYMSGLNFSDAIARIEAQFPASPERDYIVDFVRSSSRGIIRGSSK